MPKGETGLYLPDLMDGFGVPLLNVVTLFLAQNCKKNIQKNFFPRLIGRPRQ